MSFAASFFMRYCTHFDSVFSSPSSTHNPDITQINLFITSERHIFNLFLPSFDSNVVLTEDNKDQVMMENYAVWLYVYKECHKRLSI